MTNFFLILFLPVANCIDAIRHKTRVSLCTKMSLSPARFKKDDLKKTGLQLRYFLNFKANIFCHFHFRLTSLTAYSKQCWLFEKQLRCTVHTEELLLCRYMLSFLFTTWLFDTHTGFSLRSINYIDCGIFIVQKLSFIFVI